MEYKSKNLIKTVNDWNAVISAFPDMKFLGHPALRKICKPINKFDKTTLTEIKKLKTALKKYRKLTGFGKGIAAPQIGVTKRFIAIYGDQEIIMLINPKITKKSQSKTIAEELCISMGITTTFVVRLKFVTVEYLDKKGTKCVWKADVSYSRILQHEIDHLDGILPIDKALREKLRFFYKIEQFQGIKDYKK